MLRLPASVPPLPGEFIASWIIRLAEAHGQKSRSLCSFVCGQSLDYDAYSNSSKKGDHLLTRLGESTRLGKEYLRSECTLVGLQGRLFAQTGNSTKLPWILPQGSYQAWRPAMQFCPRCLDDVSPYFRRNWRLSLFTVCTDHFCICVTSVQRARRLLILSVARCVTGEVSSRLAGNVASTCAAARSSVPTKRRPTWRANTSPR